MKFCVRCKDIKTSSAELVTIETGNTEIETRFCKECGLIENSLLPHAMKELLEKAVRVGEDGKVPEEKNKTS